MFCPSCGAESAHELSYCKRCGANLKLPADPTGVTQKKLVGVAWAISLAVTAVTLGGFGMIYSLARTLIVMGQGVAEGGMLLFFCGLLMIVIIDALLIRQLSQALKLPRLPGENAPPREFKPVGTEIPQIQAPQVPAGSVTDHTTRTFAEKPVVRDRERS